MKAKILAIVGPTGSGKSAIAYKLAEKFNGEILCVDSRTVYRGMDVGTGKDTVGGDRGPAFAKATAGEQGTGKAGYFLSFLFSKILNKKTPSLSPVPCPLNPPHGINLVDPNQEMNGALFKKYAEEKISEILGRGHLPILVGGTGLWMDMIIEGRELPEVGPDLELREELESKNEDELFEEYKKIDPAGAEVIDRKNKRRLIRALEVCKKTGRAFSEFLKGGEGNYDCLWLGVDWPMEVLEKRINSRIDGMVKLGLLDEVKKLKSQYGCEIYSMSGIGYQEICRYLDGKISFDEAIAEMKLRTRQYAKRQKTWFKRNENIYWSTDVAEFEKLVDDWLRAAQSNRT